MNPLQRRHRRWLDANMPSAEETRADLLAIQRAVEAGPSRRVWPGVLVAAAAAIALVLYFRSPTPTPAHSSPTADWGVRFALHVDGQSAADDVRIHIAVRKQQR